GIGVFAIVAAWRGMPETLARRSTERASLAAILRNYRRLAGDRVFAAHLGIAAFSYAGLFAWISGSPFVLDELYGLSPLAFGIAFAAACLGSLAGAVLATSLVVRLGLDRTIGLGTLALATGGLTMVASLALGWPPVASLVLAMVIYHTGLMLAMPQAIAGAITPFPDCAGTASSLLGVVQLSSAALLGTIVGHTLGQSPWPLAAAVAAMGCLSFGLWAASRDVRTASIPLLSHRIGKSPPADAGSPTISRTASVRGKTGLRRQGPRRGRVLREAIND